MSQSRFGKFLASFAAHWFSAVSGGLSVPFTIAALYVPSRWAKGLFATLAIAAGIAASYSVWSKKTEEAETLEVELEQERSRNARPQLRATIERVGGHEVESPSLVTFIVGAMAARISAARETTGDASGQQIGWDGETAEQLKFALAEAGGLRAAWFVVFHIVLIIIQVKNKSSRFF